MIKRFKSKRYSRAHGFTLIEILVVVTILGILVAVVAPKFMSRPEQARMVKAKQDIVNIQTALELYKMDNSFYPSTDQGLQALITKPDTSPVPRDWKPEGYMQNMPIDPWGEPYQYVNDNENLRIFSYGPKGKDGNSEIGNWTQKTPA